MNFLVCKNYSCYKIMPTTCTCIATLCPFGLKLVKLIISVKGYHL